MMISQGPSFVLPPLLPDMNYGSTINESFDYVENWLYISKGIVASLHTDKQTNVKQNVL